MLDRISPLPLYYQLANKLREELKDFSPGSRFFTEQEICGKYQVSRFTVGKAISELMREKVLYRIQGSGTFVAETESIDRSRTSRASQPHNVLVFLRREFRQLVMDSDYIFADMIQGVLDGLQKTANPVLATIPKPENETSFILERIQDPGIKGVVLIPWRNIRDLVKVLKRERKPFALLNVKREAFRGMNRVLAREADGIVKATRYLIKQGHRNLIFLYTIVDEFVRNVPEQDRRAAFFRTLEQNNIAASDQCEHLWQGPDRDHGLLRLLDGPNAPTAIVAENDETALKAMRVLQNAGIRIPEDISITGFDDIPAAAGSSPALTTIHKPRRKMGVAAAKIVVEQIQKGFSLRGDTMLDTELVIRSSCAEAKLDVPAWTGTTR